MLNALVYLMILTATLQLGITTHKFFSCRSIECSAHIEKASRDVLKINWKPISVWPEEGQRFR